jgi:hypothetical protein
METSLSKWKPPGYEYERGVCLQLDDFLDAELVISKGVNGALYVIDGTIQDD